MGRQVCPQPSLQQCPESLIPVLHTGSSEASNEAEQNGDAKINEEDDEDDGEKPTEEGGEGGGNTVDLAEKMATIYLFTWLAKKKKNKKKKKKSTPSAQTEPPTIPVSKLFPNKIYPEGEIHEYRDE